MKKIFIALTFLGLFTFSATKVSAAPDCQTHIIVCDDGSMHYAVVCNHDDLLAWFEILCDETPED
jgi:hypothetical protein